MKVSIVPSAGHVSVDSEPLDFDCTGLGEFDPATVQAVHWRGTFGTIHRLSAAVPGEVDTEHFADETKITPYVDAWTAEKAKREAAAEEQKAISAEINASIARQQADQAAAAQALLDSGHVHQGG